MSEKAEMTIKVIIIIPCKTETINKEECKDFLVPSSNVKYEEFLKMVSHMPNTEVNNIVFINSVKNIIMEKLLATCENDKADIAFIIDDIESTEEQYVNEVIESVTVDRKELPIKLANLMTNIEEKLEKIMHYRTRCGIRNRTLFINLSGTHEDRKECFAAISDILVNTMHLIRQSKNEHFSLSDIASSSGDNDVSEQGKDKAVNENLKKSSSFTSSHSPKFAFTENINDNANNCHEESFPMITKKRALKILTNVADNYNKQVTQTNSESVKISDAYGRILLENIYSNCNVPLFRTSSKHGYAVLVKDGKGVRKVQDGENKFPPLPLQPGTCVWLKSGQPIPEGATAVVQEKDTKALKESPNDDSKYIEIMINPQHGQNIKTVGSDMVKGKIIVKMHTRIGPEEIAVLAASGCKEVLVIKKLSIGVLSIGDNLQEPGEPLKPGFVYDINRIALISLLKHNGYSSLDFGIVDDKVSSIQEKIKKALRKVDILVTTGSNNDKDLLKNILTNYFKAKIYFGNVNIKPGKSTTLAHCKINDETKYLLCLSRNPASAFTAAHTFLLPFVNKLHRDLSEPAVVSVQTDAPFLLHPRLRLAWVHLRWSKGDNIARTFNVTNLSEDRLRDMVGSNALLILPGTGREQNEQLFSNTENMTSALLVDCPKNFNSLFAMYENLK